MKASTLIKYLPFAIENSIPVCLIGDPGIGKTSLVRLICKLLGYVLIEIHVSEWEAVDLKGFPVVVGGVPSFVPYGAMREMLENDPEQKYVVLFDDLGHGEQDVLVNVMQIFRGGLGENKLPGNVYIMGATNDTSDKARVKGFPEPLKSSMVLLNFEFDAEDFIEHGRAQGFDNIMMAILEANPEYIHKPEPTMQLVKTPCPREWERVSKHLKGFREWVEQGKMSQSEAQSMEYDTLKGCVGHDATQIYQAQAGVIDKLPKPLPFLENPQAHLMPDHIEHASATYILTERLCAFFENPKYQTDMLRHNMWTVIEWLPQVFQRLAIQRLEKNDPTFKTMAQKQNYRVLMARDMNVI